LASNGGHWKGLEDLEIATCAWVSWFNEERIHSELEDHTPCEIEEGYFLNHQAKASGKPRPIQLPLFIHFACCSSSRAQRGWTKPEHAKVLVE
jgi:hypothetical protein